jgi:hypothetical protein
LSEDPLYDEIVRFLSDRFAGETDEQPSITDYRFVANCCLKALREDEPKTVWSGDIHIIRILEALYGKDSGLSERLPEIYLRASYTPRHYEQLFP